MATTKLDRAIIAANNLIGISVTLRGLRGQINDFVTNYTDEGFSTIWSNFATAAQNADGSLGTVDGSPNVTHPIDTRVASQTALTKDVSETQLAAGITMIQQLQNFFGNSAVTTGNYSQTTDDLAS